MRTKWFYVAGIAGVVTIGASAPGPASAQDVNRIIGTLNAIVNPQDAARLEERARREGREEERHYWRDYRAGLEHRRAEPEGAHDQPYRDGYRQGHQLGAEDARRYEEDARRRHRNEEERYWRDYRTGLGEAPAPGERRPFGDQRYR